MAPVASAALVLLLTAGQAALVVETREHAATGGGENLQWGCGLVGLLPGINSSGVATGDIRRLIDGIKSSSSLRKVNYWNWDFAPRITDGQPQYLSEDFVFMPNSWGIPPGSVSQQLRPAGAVGFLDGDGQPCPAEMATVLLGPNEPDIAGSCMGDMMGRCTAPCTAEEADHCPAAHLHGAGGRPLDNGHCNCWQFSHATGCGFWPLEGCSRLQPLPTLWEDAEPSCVSAVMAAWKNTTRTAVQKGYQYLSTPLVAEDIGYARKWIELACGCSEGRCACQEASCGCPAYVGFHFYGYDCQPEQGDYDTLQQRLDAVARIMEDYPFVKGAIINEVGMLNCARGTARCVPDSGRYPASGTPGGACPATPALPRGLATFVAEVLGMAAAARTKDGRPVVKSFAWFNLDRDGATYNLQLFEGDGSLNELGEAYIAACSKWPAMDADEEVVLTL